MLKFFKKIWEWLTTPQAPHVPERDNAAGPLPIPEPEGPVKFAEIEKALEFTLANEGGYSDHPNDNGGATKYGITIGDYSKYLGRTATKAEVKAMTKETAALIYRKFYWDPLNLDRCDDQNIATCVFDMGVLCGIGKSAQWVQEILGVKVDKKIGPVTMAALNDAKRSVFVPLFADKAQNYFNAIVAGNASQKVFLKGWTNRANRLRTLAKDDPKKDESPVLLPGEEIGAGLKDLAAEAGVPLSAIDTLIAGQKKHRPGKNPRYWAVVNLGLHSSKRRFFVFDRVGKEVFAHFTAHGSGSDTNHDGIADKFSNVSGSNCSSLGFYRCAETYMSAKNGLSMRLDGMDATNSNARARAVVVHPATYVAASYIKANGKAGRSQGCPALDPAVSKEVIGMLKDGSPLLIIGHRMKHRPPSVAQINFLIGLLLAVFLLNLWVGM